MSIESYYVSNHFFLIINRLFQIEKQLKFAVVLVLLCGTVAAKETIETPSDINLQAIASKPNFVNRDEKIQNEAQKIAQQHRLFPGDTISLVVFGEQDLSLADTRIPQSGRISFPLIGTVNVAGKTTKQLEVVIRDKLSKGYINNPRLTVKIDSYRPIFVKGAVQSIGAFPYTEGLTVATAIALAGGSKASAMVNGVSISRNGKTIGQDLLLDSQHAILSGDIISVQEEFGASEESKLYVYLHGEVNRPGEYQFRNGLTVEKAVVLAGGFTLRASRKKIAVSRIVEGQEAPAKLKKVKLYLPVQPGDIIDVGASWF